MVATDNRTDEKSPTIIDECYEWRAVELSVEAERAALYTSAPHDAPTTIRLCAATFDERGNVELMRLRARDDEGIESMQAIEFTLSRNELQALIAAHEAWEKTLTGRDRGSTDEVPF